MQEKLLTPESPPRVQNPRQSPLVSIVCPCYNEEAMLPLYYAAMRETVFSRLTDYEFELILINDGSKDKTLPILRTLAEADERVKYISFSRNFGKEAAMYAGLRHAKGEFVCVMDCDLQDPPEMIASMLERLHERASRRSAVRLRARFIGSSTRFRTRSL